MMKEFWGKILRAITFTALSGITTTIVFAGAAPFKGNANAEITEVVPGQNGVSMTAVADGNATHLGKFTRVEHLLLNQNTGAFTGDVVFTASDGSRLTANLTGQFTSATTAQGTYHFTGGTERFENAAGSANFSAEMTDAAHFSVEFEGRFE